jgi:hypothetical protein
MRSTEAKTARQCLDERMEESVRWFFECGPEAIAGFRAHLTRRHPSEVVGDLDGGEAIVVILLAVQMLDEVACRALHLDDVVGEDLPG